NFIDITTQLKEVTEEMESLEVERSYKEVLEFIYLDQQFHATILNATNNTFLLEAYEGMYSHFHIARFYRSRGGVDQQEATAEHWEIINAMETRDVYRAEVAVANHIRDVKNRLVEKSKDEIYPYG